MKETSPSELRAAFNGLRQHLRRAVGFSVVITLLALAPIGYMRDVYGPVLNARSEQSLGWVTLILVLALALSAVLMWIRSRILMAAAVRLMERTGPRVFDATFRGQLQRHTNARQALGDLRALRRFLTSPAVEALMDAPLSVIFLVLVFLVHPLVGVVSLLGALIVLVIGLLSEREVRPLVRQAQQHSNRAMNFVDSSGRNAQVIEAMGMVDSVRSIWQVFQNEYLKRQALAGVVQARGSAMSKFVMLSQGSLLLGVGVLLTLYGVLPPAAAAGIVIAKILAARAMSPMLTLINSWKQVEAARDAFERLDEFLNLHPRREQRMAMPAPRGHLSVEKASVRPPGTKQTVLMDVTFALKPGRALAVIGPSGSGKSSLVRMILGLWPPVLGTIRLDGVDVSTWDKTHLGPHIGYLPQDVELLSGTVADNIARFGPVDHEQLKRAVDLADLSNLLDQLPAGLDTEIGQDGVTLSGGQRQRVGLARALYGEPKLLVLDEPNSSLDETGERSLLKAIQEIKRRGCTVVLVTHRTKLLAVSDQILVLANGKTKMFGPRDEVLAELGSAVRHEQTRTTSHKTDRASASSPLIAATPQQERGQALQPETNVSIDSGSETEAPIVAEATEEAFLQEQSEQHSPESKAPEKR